MILIFFNIPIFLFVINPILSIEMQCMWNCGLFDVAWNGQNMKNMTSTTKTHIVA